MNRLRNLCTVLLGVSLICLSTKLYSQIPDRPDLILMPEISSMDYYFSRADAQTLDEKWIEFASFGLEMVVASWEKDVLFLLGDDFNIETLKIEAEQKLNNELTKRYTQWLSTAFFESAKPPSLGELSREIEDLNLKYLYDRQPDGSLKYKTSLEYQDLYIKDDTDVLNFISKGDKSLWIDGVKKKIDELLSDWNEKMSTGFSELKASLSDPDIKASLDGAYNSSFASYSNSYQQQLYRLYYLEQNNFINNRLNDQYSLQHQSEGETASALTDKLIAQTENQLNLKLNKLLGSFESRSGDVEIENEAVEAGDWSKSFKLLLEQGLNSWDEAEQELLMERLQWEQAAGIEAVAGEGLWIEAFTELRAERSDWMKNFRAALDEGSRLWQIESAELSSAIDQAIYEIDENISDSDEMLHGRIDNLVGMFLQSVNMMRTARSSWEYWMDRLDGGEIGSFKGQNIGFDADAMATAFEEIFDTNAAAGEEVEYWLESFRVHQSYARDTQDILAELYGIVVFDEPGLHSAFEEGQLSEALLDSSILIDESTWETVYLDSFQVEILKARACMQFWDKQLQIAQAVFDYAADKSSLKEEASVTEHRLAESKTAYDQSFEEYKASLNRLTELGSDISAIQAELDKVQTEINGFQVQLYEAREEYNKMVSDLYLDDPQYLADEYQAYYIQLLDSYGMRSESEESYTLVFEEYLMAARQYGIEYSTGKRSEHVIELLYGTTPVSLDTDLFNPETASLYELRERMITTESAGFTLQQPEDGLTLVDGRLSIAGEKSASAFMEYMKTDLFLDASDYRYAKLLELYMDDSVSAETAGKSLWEMQRIVGDLQQQRWLDYELRMAELHLYTANDCSSWAQKHLETDSPDEIANLCNPKPVDILLQAVTDDISVYKQILMIYENSQADKFIIYDWADETADRNAGYEIEGAYQKLWDYCSLETDYDTAAEIAAVVASLEKLESWLGNIDNISVHADEIEAALIDPDLYYGQDLLSIYLDGGHNLQSDSGDLYSCIFKERIASEHLKQLTAPLYSLRVENGYESIISFLIKKDLLDPDTMTFNKPSDLWEKADFKTADDVVKYFLSFDENLSELIMPFWIGDRLSEFEASLKTYFSIKSTEVFSNQRLDINVINEDIAVHIEQMNELTALVQILESSGDDIIKLRSLAESNLLSTEIETESLKRLCETAALDLAVKASASGSFEGSSESWNNLFNEYDEYGELQFQSDEILGQADNFYRLAAALADPLSVDWTTAPEDWLVFYRAARWNAFESASDLDSLNLSELESHYAAVHFLQKKIISGISFPKLESEIENNGLFSNVEISEFEEMFHSLELLKIYKPLLHGSLNAFLNEKCSNEDQKSELREIYYRFYGSAAYQFDDPVFTPAFGTDGFDAAFFLDYLVFNKTRRISGAAFPICSCSANEVFIDDAASKIVLSLYGDDDSFSSKLSHLYLQRELTSLCQDYINSLNTADADHWRSFLSGEISDYDRDLTIDEDLSHALLIIPDEQSFKALENDRGNFILEAEDCYLDKTAFFVKALEAWAEGDAAVMNMSTETLALELNGNPSPQFWQQMSSATASSLAEDYGYQVDSAVYEAYVESHSRYLNLSSSIETIKERLASYGIRRAKLLRILKSDDDTVAAELNPLKDCISELEYELDAARIKWQTLMDGGDGFKIHEAEYAEEFNRMQQSLNDFEAAEHEHSIASAVHDYASSGYLDGINILIEEVAEVSPLSRLEYTTDKHRKASAAYHALSKIVDENIDNMSAYSNDAVYREFFDYYLESFKQTLVMQKINLVLNEAVTNQKAEICTVFDDWNAAIEDSYGPVILHDSEGDLKIPSGLENFQFSRNAEGEWEISQGEDPASLSNAEAYFGVGEESVEEHSPFLNDLMTWLEKLNDFENRGKLPDLLITWGMAEKWTDYSEVSAEDRRELQGEFWGKYLDRNKEADLDRQGAGALLIDRWQSAYSTVSAYSGDLKWMHSFYKMLQAGDLMKIETSAGGAEADETFDYFAREKSIALANQYMSDKYKENAKELKIASVPFFTFAAIYYAAATAVLAIPFGGIAAAILFATAAGLTLGGTSLLGEGMTKDAAAEYIKNEIVNKSERNIDHFRNDFNQSTKSILDKKQNYEEELQKLENMTGAAGPALLSHDQRISNLMLSVSSGFNSAGESLDELLRLTDEPTLEFLFNDLIKDFDEEQLAGCGTSCLLLSALENESQDRVRAAEFQLHNYVYGPGGAVDIQEDIEAEYKSAYYSYLNGEIGLDEYENAAVNAWGRQSFSEREHLLRHYEEQAVITDSIISSNQFPIETAAKMLNSGNELLLGNMDAAGIHESRMDNYRDVKTFEMQIKKLELNERIINWENQMKAISALGEFEWSSAESRFEKQHDIWQTELRTSYDDQNSIWKEKYTDFLNDKQSWLDSVSIQSLEYGNSDVLDDFGEMTDASIAVAGDDVKIYSPAFQCPDPSRILEGLIEHNLLDSFLARSEILADSLGGGYTFIASQFTPPPLSTADNIQAVYDFQTANNEDYMKHLKQIELTNLVDKADAAEQQFKQIIMDANNDVAGGLHKTMRDDGYVLKGSQYERSLLTGASLSGYIYEDGFVSLYNYFKPEQVDFSTELKSINNDIEVLDSDVLGEITSRIIDNIRTALEKIFGDDEGVEIFQTEITQSEKESGPIESVIAFFKGIGESRSNDSSIAADLENRTVSLNPGLFGLHIGFAPEFSSNADTDLNWDSEGQLKFSGQGELGRIMGEFMFNKLREGSGWKEVNLPHYRKPLWDDSESFIKAPTMADVTNMTVSLLTMGAGGIAGIWGSMAVGLADDLLLTSMDIGTGHMTFTEGIVDFGKKTAAATLGTLGGELFGSIDTGSLELSNNILLNIGEQAYGNTTSTLINSLSYNSETGFGYSLRNLDEGLFGAQAVSGYAATAAGQGITGFISDSFSPLENAFYGSLADLGGAAAGSAAEYTVYSSYELLNNDFNDLPGSFTRAFNNMDLSLNILDMGTVLDAARLTAVSAVTDYSDSYLSGLNTAAENLRGAGLFSLNFDSTGMSGSFSGGGYNIGGSLYDLGKGAVADIGIDVYDAEFGSTELLKTGYAYGDQNFEDTIWRLLAGSDSLNFDAAAGLEAETVKSGSGRDIHLSSAYASGDELLKAALVLQHEAHRDGMALNNDAETYKAVRAHTEMLLGLASSSSFNLVSGDNNLTEDVLNYLCALQGQSFDEKLFRKYTAENYDSSSDYWCVLSDGNIMFDGSKNLYDENRDILKEYGGSGGFTASLAEILDISFNEADLMMRRAGWSWDDGTFKVDGMSVDVKNNIEEILLTDRSFKARYDIQMDIVDKVWDEFDGDMTAAVSWAKEEINLARASGTMTDKLSAKYNVLSRLEDFALTWNETIHDSGLWDQQRARDYIDNNISAEFDHIYDDFLAGRIDDNYMYKAVNNTIFPIEGYSYITTKSIYQDTPDLRELGLSNKPHGQAHGGAAVDLGTKNLYLPIFTTQLEHILFDSFLGYQNAGGYTYTGYSNNFQKLSMHMLECNYISMMLEQLNSDAEEAYLFRTTLPVGFNYGYVGNSGEKSTGVHLHWELNPYVY